MAGQTVVTTAPTAALMVAGSMTPTRRWSVLAGFATWLGFVAVVVLGAIAPLTRTGDAHQYYAMAFNLAAGEPPALTADQVAEFKNWLAFRPADSDFPSGVRVVDQPPLVVDGRQEFSHFWLYPLLVAPGILLTQQLGLAPGYAFLAVNAILLGLALWQVQRTYSAVVSLFLLATPLIWFINKAQVEVFTVALLSLAMAFAGRGRWSWAALTAAIAATQNAPLLAAVLCFWGAGLLMAARTRPRPRLSPVTGLVVLLTVIIGLAHPVYYWWRLGVLTPQQLNGGIAFQPPTLERYLAVLVDPDLGLLAWLPVHAALAGLGLVLIWWWPRRPPRVAPAPATTGTGDTATAGLAIAPAREPDAWSTRRLAGLCGLVLGLWLLVVFAQTTNVNSGGTVHISRYALWLVPLGLPFLATAAAWLGSYLPGLLPVAGSIALVVYVVLFRPAQPEQYAVQSPQAAAITLLAPELYRTVPEIFAERQRRQDGGVRGSAALETCRIILLAAGDRTQPCPLTPAEQETADTLLAGDWQSVWITRPGPFRLTDGGVRGAVPRP